jgi:hypothetical protein
LQYGAIGKDKEEPIGMVSEQVRNARQQEWFSAGDHERHHTQSNRFVHNSVPVAEAQSRLRWRAGDGSYGSGEAADAAQIAFGSDAENEKGWHLYSAAKRTGAHALRLFNRSRKTKEPWEVSRMLHDPRNQNTRQLRINALDPAREAEKAAR